MATQELQVTVYEDSEMLISRVRREDGKVAILKQLSRNAKPEVRKRLRHEYKLLAGIDLPGVVKTFGLEERMDGCLILSLEDIGGDSLDRLLEPNEHLGVVPFLKLAIGLAETLMELHRLQIVHKAINPAHIVMNTAGEFRLVGFGVADTLPQS
jgi:serine/threonine protein kinase